VLQAAADNAAEAEAQFRRDANQRFSALEAARAFAHRRLNLMRTIANAAAQPESEEIAVANALAVLREKLGWHGDSDARSEGRRHVAMRRARADDATAIFKRPRRPRAMCSSPRREACDAFGLKLDGVGH